MNVPKSINVKYLFTLTDKSETIRPELSNASDKVASASSLSQDEVKELNRLLGKVIHAFDETKEK